MQANLRNRTIQFSKWPPPRNKNLLTTVVLKTTPIQLLIRKQLRKSSVDLVLTDPPYADQAPYLEYSELWVKILGLGTTKGLWRNEIVKTDAPDRSKDNQEYASRLAAGIGTCCDLLKPGGYLAFFYQDRSLEHWIAIRDAVTRKGVAFKDVIPLPKQRRSIKTVTSPGRTIDGDLLIICQRPRRRKGTRAVHQHNGSAPEIRVTKKTIRMGVLATPFQQYADLVRGVLVDGEGLCRHSNADDIFELASTLAQSPINA